MKKKIFKSFLFIGIVIVTLSSCTSYNRAMREPNARIEFNKNDFTLSEQVTAEATETKIIGIDFSRLFTRKTGVAAGNSAIAIPLSSIPAIGSLMFNRVTNYALYALMQNNPGYDVVFYPQYETKIRRPIGIGFFYKITTVKTTARLGKLNK